MLVIRLQRVGKKNAPSFRVVLMDSRRAAKSGAFLEILGSHSPRRKMPPQLKAERIQYWLSKGAKPSGTVHNLLVRAKIIKGPKMDVSPSVKKKDEEVKAAPKPAIEPAAETAEAKKEAA